MNRKFFSMWLLMVIFMLTGCGKDSPEDVATKFAISLSDADIKTVESISSDNVHKQLDHLVIACNKDLMNELYRETKEILIQIEKKKSDEKTRSKIDTLMKNFKQDSKKSLEKIKYDLVEEYGTLSKLPKDVRESIQNKTLEKATTLIEPVAEEMFKILDIQMQHPHEIKDIFSAFLIKSGARLTYRNQRILQNIIKEYVRKNSKKITPKCINQYTDFGLIDEINFIETKQSAPDEATVRLEIIHTNGKSNKISVEVENIQKEWKVSRLPLKIGFW